MIFVTNSPDTNNVIIDMFYNRDAGNKDLLGHELDPNIFYFTNNKYGNNYKFNGDLKAALYAPKTLGKLLTPASSSSASCTAGEFKDDANYHYVCVSTNKWKRVALIDF